MVARALCELLSAKKHPNADRLSVTKIDDGGAVADVPRDDNGYVQVVCGAPNVHADMWAIGCHQKAPSQQVLMTPSRSCWMRDRCVES